MRSLRLSYSVVSRFLAVLLIVAAVLKLAGLAVDPVGRVGLFTSTTFQIAVIEFEFFLAAWLFWGKRPLGSWATALAVFTIFAAFNIYQGSIGRASCGGCLGPLSSSISPWYMLGLDLAVLLALLLGRPDLEAVWRQPWMFLMSLLPALYGMIGAVMFLALFVGLANWRYGSPDAALAHFRGERISLYPRTVDVGTGIPREERETAVEVANRTNHPIRLLGGTKD